LYNKRDQARVLIRNLVHLIDNSRQRLEDLSTKEFPFEESQSILETVDKINEDIIRRLEEIQNASPRLDDEDIVATVLLYGQSLGHLEPIFLLLDTTQRENLPQAYVYLIRHLCEKFSKKAQFVLQPTYDSSFHYVDILSELRKNFEYAIPNISQFFPLQAERLAVISFPYAYNGDIVASSLLAHEIGHYLIETNNLMTEPITKIKFDSSKLQDIV
jgi:hypothetical protein